MTKEYEFLLSTLKSSVNLLQSVQADTQDIFDKLGEGAFNTLSMQAIFKIHSDLSNKLLEKITDILNKIDLLRRTEHFKNLPK